MAPGSVAVCAVAPKVGDIGAALAPLPGRRRQLPPTVADLVTFTPGTVLIGKYYNLVL